MVSEEQARLAIVELFPNVDNAQFEITSPRDFTYNCIAWAANDNGRWWWPGDNPFMFWPKGCERVEAKDAFIAAFGTIGYSESTYVEESERYEYVAIFFLDSVPTHASRQLKNGSWTSKLGEEWDISHSIDGLNGTEYGEPDIYMKRAR